jgi:pterin-4a-carbinolamine dehydratase
MQQDRVKRGVIAMKDKWIVRKRPARLERRIEFAEYEETREFLEKAAELSESVGYYPDISFGRTHVNITLQDEDQDNKSEVVSDEIQSFADKMDVLIPSAPPAD